MLHTNFILHTKLVATMTFSESETNVAKIKPQEELALTSLIFNREIQVCVLLCLRYS